MNVAMADSHGIPFIGGRQNAVELSRTGRTQACGLGRYALREGIVPTDVYCSPAVRTRRTQEISSVVMGLTLSPIIDERLQELDQGDWTNQPRSLYDEPANKRLMARLGSDFAPPHGESMNDVAARMEDFFGSLTLTPDTDLPQHIWAFTHGVATKTWAGRLCGWSHERTYKTPIDNVSLTRFARKSGRWSLVFLNLRTV